VRDLSYSAKYSNSHFPDDSQVTGVMPVQSVYNNYNTCVRKYVISLMVGENNGNSIRGRNLGDAKHIIVAGYFPYSISQGCSTVALESYPPLHQIRLSGHGKPSFSVHVYIHAAQEHCHAVGS